MGYKVKIIAPMADKLLPTGRIIKELDKGMVPALFSIASIKVLTPADVLTSAKARAKVVLLDQDIVEQDLILEDAEYDYLNDLIDPKSGKYNPDLIMNASIAPLIEMFRAATPIKLKEEEKSKDE